MTEFVGCPEEGCADLAEVRDRYTLPSTDGPVAHRITYCLSGHRITTTEEG